MSRRLVAVLALTCGLAVANLYYVQPLLNVIGKAFGVSHGVAGLLVTASQVGYVLGLAFLVPVGDLVERRRLICLLLLGAAVAAGACAAAPGFGVLLAALVALGALAVVAQVVVPLASTLAGPEERGSVVGTVMSGLLIGILGARTLAGLIAEAGGWRLVFGVAAGAMVVLSAVLWRELPVVAPTDRVRYRGALRSVLSLIVEEPVLRQRMALGFLQFSGFSVLWTSIAFVLGGHPYDYGEGVIGLFGLAGVAGALGAPLAGRWADRGHGRLVLTIFLITIFVSWGLSALGGTSLPALIVGIVVLDFGIQGSQVSNQTTIYALRPEARSRLTTAYMATVFTGGVVGSVLSTSIYAAAGWHATCALGAGMAFLALCVWGATEYDRSRWPGKASTESSSGGSSRS